MLQALRPAGGGLDLDWERDGHPWCEAVGDLKLAIGKRK
jgi:hypothetical protein